jgi:hypothetical protein
VVIVGILAAWMILGGLAQSFRSKKSSRGFLFWLAVGIGIAGVVHRYLVPVLFRGRGGDALEPGVKVQGLPPRLPLRWPASIALHTRVAYSLPRVTESQRAIAGLEGSRKMCPKRAKIPAATDTVDIIDSRPVVDSEQVVCLQ